MEIGILKNTATVEGCRKMLIELKTPAMANIFVKLATCIFLREKARESISIERS